MNGIIILDGKSAHDIEHLCIATRISSISTMKSRTLQSIFKILVKLLVSENRVCVGVHFHCASIGRN
ncbi:hypothetical protein DYY67_1669 [Candidatus Nitrosotalea sp. TS]|nr:hypothetical protein [Candidatus Nitrosotalea sp. TS]